nr:NADP-dependent D-sorbitol-6-phosphate dehydrogenase-like [Ipomoea batatas]
MHINSICSPFQPLSLSLNSSPYRWATSIAYNYGGDCGGGEAAVAAAEERPHSSPPSLSLSLLSSRRGPIRLWPAGVAADRWSPRRIAVGAHTPLGGAVAITKWFGSVSCLEDPVLKGIAEKYKKTVAQIVLCLGIQRNTVVIPKSSKVERLEENFNVFDFELSKEDMELIKSVDRNHRTNQPAKFWGIAGVRWAVVDNEKGQQLDVTLAISNPRDRKRGDVGRSRRRQGRGQWLWWFLFPVERQSIQYEEPLMIDGNGGAEHRFPLPVSSTACPLLVQALENENFDDLVDPRLERNFVAIEMLRMIKAAAACVRH